MVPDEGAMAKLSLGVGAHQAKLPGRAQDVSHMEEVVRLKEKVTRAQMAEASTDFLFGLYLTIKVIFVLQMKLLPGPWFPGPGEWG